VKQHFCGGQKVFHSFWKIGRPKLELFFIRPNENKRFFDQNTKKSKIT